MNIPLDVKVHCSASRSSGNDVRFCRRVMYENYHYRTQDLPQLLASSTSAHLLWWAQPLVVGLAFLWMKEADTHDTHTHTQGPKLGPLM